MFGKAMQELRIHNVSCSNAVNYKSFFAELCVAGLL